jgi:hypothetical protein
MAAYQPRITANMVDGPINKLEPIRMADIRMSKVESFDSLRSAAETASVPATPAGPAKYVPPSLRAAAKTPTGKAAMPTSLDTGSADLFPTLGAAPSPKVASWGQLRARLGAPAPNPGAPTPIQSTNAFAALAEEAPGAPGAPTLSPLNFKAMMDQRLEKDAAEAVQREIPETDDPLEMTHGQLAAAGWACLDLPGLSATLRKTLERNNVAVSTCSPAPEDPDTTFTVEEWDWNQMGIPEEIKDSGDSIKMLRYLCRYAQEDIGQSLEIATGGIEADVKVRSLKPAFEQLLARKRANLKSKAD